MTGAAFSTSSLSGSTATSLSSMLPVLANRIVTLTPSNLRAHPIAETLVRAAARCAAFVPRHRLTSYDILFLAHDALCAASPWPRGIDAVYAYEDAALRTFRRAEREGLERIYDLPAPHWAAVESILRHEQRRHADAWEPPSIEPDSKKRRKDEELRLATRIIVASSFTRDTVLRARPCNDISVVSYGFPVELFPLRHEPPTGVFTALAVGTQSFRKGTSYLLDAWQRAALPDARLRLVGPMRLSGAILSRYVGRFEHIPHVPRSRLSAEYAAADVLVFPSLADGFGLAIQEAMCTGVPVIATRSCGAPECIVDGVEGFIVPAGDVDALADALRHAHRSRDTLVAMGQHARRRAESWTWQDAGLALASALRKK